jgi:hypothetical protein
MLGHSKLSEESRAHAAVDDNCRVHESHVRVFPDRNVKLEKEMPEEFSEHQMESWDRIREAAGQTC